MKAAEAPATLAPSPDDFLTVEEIAVRLRVSKSYVYVLMRSGGLSYVELPNCKTGSKHNGRYAARRVKRSVLDQFISDNLVAQA